MATCYVQAFIDTKTGRTLRIQPMSDWSATLPTDLMKNYERDKRDLTALRWFVIDEFSAGSYHLASEQCRRIWGPVFARYGTNGPL